MRRDRQKVEWEKTLTLQLCRLEDEENLHLGEVEEDDPNERLWDDEARRRRGGGMCACVCVCVCVRVCVCGGGGALRPLRPMESASMGMGLQHQPPPPRAGMAFVVAMR